MFWHLFWVHVWSSVAAKILCQIRVWRICYSPALGCNGHLLGLFGRTGMPFPPKLCQMSGNLQKTVGVPHLAWWLQLSPSFFLGKGDIHGFLSCLHLEVGGSRSTEFSELWLLPLKLAHLLPCVFVCLILLLAEAGPGGFSGVEGFLQPGSALWGRADPACSHQICLPCSSSLLQKCSWALAGSRAVLNVTVPLTAALILPFPFSWCFPGAEWRVLFESWLFFKDFNSQLVKGVFGGARIIMQCSERESSTPFHALSLMGERSLNSVVSWEICRI